MGVHGAGRETTVVDYAIRAVDWDPLPACSLEVRPLIAFRDYHSFTYGNGGLNGSIRAEAGVVSVEPYPGLPRLFLAHDAYDVQAEGNCRRRLWLRRRSGVTRRMRESCGVLKSSGGSECGPGRRLTIPSSSR